LGLDDNLQARAGQGGQGLDRKGLEENLQARAGQGGQGLDRKGLDDNLQTSKDAALNPKP